MAQASGRIGFAAGNFFRINGQLFSDELLQFHDVGPLAQAVVVRVFNC